jgi:hypothetical protein
VKGGAWVHLIAGTAREDVPFPAKCHTLSLWFSCGLSDTPNRRGGFL